LNGIERYDYINGSAERQTQWLRVAGVPMRRTKSHAAVFPFDDCHAPVGYWDGMDVERIIDEIEILFLVETSI
jgi:hypothetical protein